MKFIKSTIITFISNMIIFGISFVTTIFTSRILGAEGKGVLGVANNAISFSLIFLGFGIAASNVFYIGKDKKQINNILGINILVTIISIFGSIIIYFLNSKYNFGFLKGIDNKILITLLIVIPVMNLKSLFISILLGLQEVVRYNKLNVIDRMITFASLSVFLIIFKTAYSALLSSLIASVIMIIILFYILFFKYKFRFSFESCIFKNMFKYGIKAQIGNIIQTLNYRLDIFIINYYLPIAQVGIYTNAVALGETMWKVTGSVGTVILPMTTNSKDKIQMKDFINKVTRISFYTIIVCSIVLIIISKPLIYLLLGEEFLPAARALILLIPGISIFSISNILSNYLAGIGKVEKNIIASIVSCILTVILDLMLVPKMGIDGAAIGTSISYIVFTSITIVFYTRATKSKILDIILLKRSDVEEIKVRLSKLPSIIKKR